MGVSMSDIERGLLDANRVLVAGMQTWDVLAGKPPTTAPATTEPVSKPAVANQQSVATATPQAPTGLAAVPVWVWIAGAVAGLWYLGRR